MRMTMALTIVMHPHCRIKINIKIKITMRIFPNGSLNDKIYTVRVTHPDSDNTLSRSAILMKISYKR